MVILKIPFSQDKFTTPARSFQSRRNSICRPHDGGKEDGLVCVQMEGFGFDPIAHFCLFSELRKKCRDQNPGRANAPPGRFASPFESLKSNQRMHPGRGASFGADGEIRTLKLSPADFKSAVYAVPPHLQLIDYTSFCAASQSGGALFPNRLQTAPICDSLMESGAAIPLA